MVNAKIIMKRKVILLGLLGLISLSSCGIFHKGCGCPHFGAIKVEKFENLKIC